MWRDNKKKIRRFLRDPNGNIWTDGLLKRLFNDSQVDLNEQVGMLEKIQALRVPPMYQMSYMFPWEWNQRDADGKVYNCFKFHQQSSWVCAFKWETQEVGLSTGAESDEGYAFIHPWEGFVVGDTNARIPFWFPYDFKSAKFIAYDKEPISFKPIKQIQSDDQSWKTQSGKPQYYYREDTLSNEFYLYPEPSITWDDINGNAINGQVLFSEEDDGTGYWDTARTAYWDTPRTALWDTERSEGDSSTQVGTILDMLGIVDNQNEGIVTDVVEHENNILMIYDGHPTDIESQDDEPSYPRFIQKYIEHATLEHAYSTNSDGRIGSLKDYWKWRKELGYELMKNFKWKRLADRDFRLVSKGGGGMRNRKAPRLPDEYPRFS